MNPTNSCIKRRQWCVFTLIPGCLANVQPLFDYIVFYPPENINRDENLRFTIASGIILAEDFASVTFSVSKNIYSTGDYQSVNKSMEDPVYLTRSAKGQEITFEVRAEKVIAAGFNDSRGKISIQDELCNATNTFQIPSTETGIFLNDLKSVSLFYTAKGLF